MKTIYLMETQKPSTSFQKGNHIQCQLRKWNALAMYKRDWVQVFESSKRKTSNSNSIPRTQITWASFLGSEEPSLKLLCSTKLQRTNSSPISNCQRSKSAIFLSRNINSLLQLCVGMHMILHTGSRNEKNIGAATGRTQAPY